MSYEVLLAGFIGIILGCLVFFLLTRMVRAKRGVAAVDIPRFSEKEAEGLLRRAGFQIVGKKQKETVITIVDGKERFGQLEADYLVRKNRRKFVAVVHSGEGSADPNEPAFRRRLIELDRVFHSDAILVLDLNRGEIHSIGFRFPKEWNIDVFFRFLIALFIIFLVIGIIWMLAALGLF